MLNGPCRRESPADEVACGDADPAGLDGTVGDLLLLPQSHRSLVDNSALTGLFFMRYSLLVTPVNYVLCSVNIALFGSSAWHLGRKVKADYIDKK